MFVFKGSFWVFVVTIWEFYKLECVGGGGGDWHLAIGSWWVLLGWIGCLERVWLGMSMVIVCMCIGVSTVALYQLGHLCTYYLIKV